MYQIICVGLAVRGDCEGGVFIEAEGNGGPHNGDRVGIRCGDGQDWFGMGSGVDSGYCL
jgi:hypothetical protein